MSGESLRALVDTVQESTSFSAFAKRAPNNRLVHVFVQGTPAPSLTELGFYDPDADMITVFGASAPFAASEEQAVFRGEHAGARPPGLDGLPLTQIAVGVSAAHDLVTAFAAKHHPAHPIAQEILVLQQRDGVPVWGGTLLTHTLHVLLLQIDARDGAVRSSELRNILDLRAPE